MLTKYAEMRVLEASRGTMRPSSQVTAGRRNAHRAVFDYEPREGFIYVRSRAISSRCNDNFDEFPAEEIKRAYSTFIGKPVFVNHHNDDHRRARGVILDAVLHEDVNPDGSPDTWAEVLMEVDAVKFPKLSKAILAGHIDRTSMGTDVAYSVCSVCANKASSPMEYCKHIPGMKGQTIWQATASGTKEGVLVRELCYGLHFFENSLLVEDPADPTAFFLGVDDRGVGGGYQGDVKVAASQRSGGEGNAQRISREALRQHVGKRNGLSAVAGVRRSSSHRPGRRPDGGGLRLKHASGGRPLAVDKNAQRQYMRLAPDVRTEVNRVFRQVRSGDKIIKPLRGHPKKYRAKFTVNGVFYVMLIEDVGAYDRVRWVGTHEDANKTVYKVSLRRQNSLEVVNMGKRNRRRRREATGRKQGYGEVKAPQQIDTLRPEDEEDVSPVPPFDDPDLDAAREMDLREELGDFDGGGDEQVDEALLAEVSEVLNEVRQMLAPDSVEEQVRDQLADLREMLEVSDGLDSEEDAGGESEDGEDEDGEEDDLPEFMTADDEDEEDEEENENPFTSARRRPVRTSRTPSEGVNRVTSKERSMPQARRPNRQASARRVLIQPRLAGRRTAGFPEGTYEGWANHATWNVALLINNDEGLYHMAKEYNDYESFAEALREFGLTETTDGVAFNDSGLDIAALDEMFEELRSEGSRRRPTAARRRTAVRDQHWYQEGYARGKDDAQHGGVTVEDALEYGSGPLSGEFAGESIPEIFGSWEDATDDAMDSYEEGYWDGLRYGNDQPRSTASRRPVASKRRTAMDEIRTERIDVTPHPDDLERIADMYEDEASQLSGAEKRRKLQTVKEYREMAERLRATSRRRRTAGTTVTMQGDQSERIFDAYSDRTYSAAEINGATMLSMNEDSIVHLRLKNGNEAFVQSIDLEYHSTASRRRNTQTVSNRKRPSRRVVKGQTKMSSTLRTLAEVKRLLQEVKKNQRAVQAQVNYIGKAAGLERQLKVVRKRADVENPAQPIPEPTPEATPYTTEVARDHTDADLLTPGGVAEVSDVSEDYNVDLLTPGGVHDVELTDGGDVTVPVAGTTEQRPYDETVTNAEVQYRDLDTELAYPESQPLFGEEAKEARFVAALRLARLRLQAGIASGDDLTLATSISQSKMKTSAIRQEIKTLDEVVKAGQKKPVSRTAARRLVPKAAGRTAPSMAAEAAVTSPTAPLGVSGEEFLWD